MAGPSQDTEPQMVFSVVSSTPGCEGKLQALVEEIGPEHFAGVHHDASGKLTVDISSAPDDQFADAEEDEEDLEEIEEEKQPGTDGKFVVPVVAMPTFDSYGLPKDGFNYYKFIKNEVSGGDFIAAEPQPDVPIVRDSDFSKKLTPQERAVLEALENAEDYESLSDDFLEEAAQTPEAGPSDDDREEEKEFEKVAEEYMRDQLVDDYPRKIIEGSELAALMEEFKREHPDLTPAEPDNSQPSPEVPIVLPAPIPYTEDHCLQRVINQESDEDADEIAEQAYEKLAYREPEETDDVESVVSTYTNTDNRPAVISVRKGEKRLRKRAKANEPTDDKETPKPPPGAIPDNETKEEKKQRKAAIKAARRAQRQVKKDLKETFTSEKVRQLHQTSGKYDTPQGYSVMKIT